MPGDVKQRPAADGVNRLVFRHQPGAGPGLLFLHGYRSDMTGTKADYLADLCRQQGRAFTAFDCRGHGRSTGHYTEFTVGDWLADARQILAETEGPQILVGSSLGGWLMCLLARELPERIHALVGIAPAPDFPRELILPQITPAQKTELEQTGRLVVPSPYTPEPTIFTQAMIEESLAHPVLGTRIGFTGPVRLLQGMKDTDVPWTHALRLAEVFPEASVRLTLFPEGGHQLTTPPQLAELGRVVGEVSTVRCTTRSG